MPAAQAPAPVEPPGGAEEFDDEEATMVMQRPALDAIRAAAASAGAQAPIISGSAAPEVAQEWYVGIDDEPQGPVGYPFLREQFRLGKVTPESLVWKEDLPDWKPLKTFPALLRAVVGTPKPAAGRAPKPAAPAPKAAAPAPAKAKKPPPKAAAPTTPKAAAPKPSPVELPPAADEAVPPSKVPKPASLGRLEGQAAAAKEAAAPAADKPSEPPAEAAEDKPDKAAATAKAAAAAADQPAPADELPGPKLSSLFGDDETDAGAEPAEPAEPADKAPVEPPPAADALVDEQREPKAPERSKRRRRRKKKGMHPVVWAFIAMAGGFGAVAAYVWLTGGKQADGVTPTTAPDAALSSSAVPSGSVTVSVSGAGSVVKLDTVDIVPSPTGKSSSKPQGTAAGNAKSADSSEPDDFDPDAFGPSVDGPSAGPASGSGADGKGLTPEQVSTVIGRYKRGVSRKCMSFVTGSEKTGSARVTVLLTIAPSGQVQSATTSGGGGFPGLASCVKSRVMSWRFPKAGGTTQVSVPFHFISQ